MANTTLLSNGRSEKSPSLMNQSGFSETFEPSIPIKTDVNIYQTVEGAERAQLIINKEECQICLIKFTSSHSAEGNSKLFEIVKSNIDKCLQQDKKEQEDIGKIESNKYTSELGNYMDARFSDAEEGIFRQPLPSLELSSSVSSDSSADSKQEEIKKREHSYYHLVCFQSHYSQAEIIRSLDKFEERRLFKIE